MGARPLWGLLSFVLALSVGGAAWAADADNVRYQDAGGNWIAPVAGDRVQVALDDPYSVGLPTVDGAYVRGGFIAPVDTNNNVRVTGNIDENSVVGGASEGAAGGNVTGNTITVSAGATVHGHIIGGVNNSSSTATALTDHNAVIFNGTSTYIVTGGFSKSGGASTFNTVTINGGSVANGTDSAIVQGGVSRAGTGPYTPTTSAVSDNAVTINSTGIFNFINGGVIDNGDPGATMARNSVTVSNATVTRGIVGSNSQDGTVNISDSHVTVNNIRFDGAGVDDVIAGALGRDAGVLQGNTVSVNGGEFTDLYGIFGAYVPYDIGHLTTADANFANLTGVTVAVSGGVSASRTAVGAITGGALVITRSNVTSSAFGVAGGFSDQGGAVAGATAIIEDSQITGDVFGGRSGTAAVTDNEVNLTRSVVTGNVYGGFTTSAVAAATGNTVYLESARISGDLYGGLNLGTPADNQVILRSGRNEVAGVTRVGGKLTVLGGDNYFAGNVTAVKPTAGAELYAVEFAGGVTELGDGLSATTGSFLTRSGATARLTGGNVTLSGSGTSFTVEGGATLSVESASALTITAPTVDFMTGANLNIAATNLSLAGTAASIGNGATVTFEEKSGVRGSLSVNLGTDLVAVGDVVNVVLIGDFSAGAPINLINNAGAATLVANNYFSLFHELGLDGTSKILQAVAPKSSSAVLGTIAAAKGFARTWNFESGLALVERIRSDPASAALAADLTKMLNHLYLDVPGGQAELLLRQYIGEALIDNQRAAVSTAIKVQGLVYGRLDRVREYNSLTPPGAGDEAPSAGDGSELNRIWVGGFGNWAKEKNGDGVLGYKYEASGFALGYDRSFAGAPGFTLGASLAASFGKLKNNDGLTKTDVDTLGFGIYASYLFDNGVFIDGSGAFANSKNDYKVNLADGSGQKSGSFDIKTYQYGLRVGLMKVVEGFQIIPSIGARYTLIRQDGWTETARSAGVPVAANRFGKVSDHQVDIPFLLKINRTFETSFGSVTPEIRLGYEYTAKKADGELEVGYVGSSRMARLRGIKSRRGTALTGAGLKVKTESNWDVFANYDLEFGGSYRNHEVGLGIGFEF
jgi:outer membrane autotransporter protein